MERIGKGSGRPSSGRPFSRRLGVKALIKCYCHICPGLVMYGTQAR